MTWEFKLTPFLFARLGPSVPLHDIKRLEIEFGPGQNDLTMPQRVTAVYKNNELRHLDLDELTIERKRGTEFHRFYVQ